MISGCHSLSGGFTVEIPSSHDMIFLLLLHICVMLHYDFIAKGTALIKI
uniref:Uncharacterized protein n=1 Tax=Anguilla anguilla TaxID=7936 RepID=A0A0E9WDM7_ANGAN